MNHFMQLLQLWLTAESHNTADELNMSAQRGREKSTLSSCPSHTPISVQNEQQLDLIIVRFTSCYLSRFSHDLSWKIYRIV